MHHKLIVCKLTTILLFLLAFGGLYIAPAFAADWPQFQGPDRSGVSSEKGLARTWPEGGPTELWSTNLGEGFSGAAVKDGEVFVVDRNGELLARNIQTYHAGIRSNLVKDKKKFLVDTSDEENSEMGDPDTYLKSDMNQMKMMPTSKIPTSQIPDQNQKLVGEKLFKKIPGSNYGTFHKW